MDETASASSIIITSIRPEAARFLEGVLDCVGSGQQHHCSSIETIMRSRGVARERVRGSTFAEVGSTCSRSPWDTPARRTPNSASRLIKQRLEKQGRENMPLGSGSPLAGCPEFAQVELVTASGGIGDIGIGSGSTSGTTQFNFYNNLEELNLANSASLRESSRMANRAIVERICRPEKTELGAGLLLVLPTRRRPLRTTQRRPVDEEEEELRGTTAHKSRRLNSRSRRRLVGRTPLAPSRQLSRSRNINKSECGRMLSLTWANRIRSAGKGGAGHNRHIDLRPARVGQSCTWQARCTETIGSQEQLYRHRKAGEPRQPPMSSDKRREEEPDGDVEHPQLRNPIRTTFDPVHRAPWLWGHKQMPRPPAKANQMELKFQLELARTSSMASRQSGNNNNNNNHHHHHPNNNNNNNNNDDDDICHHLHLYNQDQRSLRRSVAYNIRMLYGSGRKANWPREQVTNRIHQTPSWIGASISTLIFGLLITSTTNSTAQATVDCFKCSSRNGSNPACEDPFHNMNTTRVNLPILPDPPPPVVYHTPCYAGRKGRDGLFPASACIKLVGTFDTGETLLVRHCALDSGSLTQDTELARMSHCGKFQFEGDLLRGCVLACPEDACNGATSILLSPYLGAACCRSRLGRTDGRDGQAATNRKHQAVLNQSGKSAFDWNLYKNRRTALQHLKRNQIHVDTILESEDGHSYELVHSQVISAFGEKMNSYVETNKVYLEDGQVRDKYRCQLAHPSCRLAFVRLDKVNSYTLGVLIDCAYSGYIRTDLQSGGIWQVLQVAEHYEMVEVVRACCAFLIKNLNRENCVKFYHVGGRYRHALQRCAWHKIRANFKHVLTEDLLRNNLTREDAYSQMHQQPRSRSILGSSSGSVSSIRRAGIWSRAPRTRASSRAIITEHQQEVVPMDLEDGSIGVDPIGSESSVANSPTISAPSPSRPLTTTTTSSSSSWPTTMMTRSRTATAAATISTNNNNNENSLATIKFEHFEPLLTHDKLNVDDEETVWYAIKLWCHFRPSERASKLASLLSCMRFPRFRLGLEFSQRYLWRDQLVLENEMAQQQLALLDKYHRNYLAGPENNSLNRDGFNLPCAPNPRQVRPRVPHSVLLAIGGWQQGHPTTLIESYDMNCNLWFTSNKRILSPLAYHGAEFINGLLFVCGGTDGNEILNEVFTFDPIRGDCYQKVSMREARCYVSTANPSPTHLYAIGGHNGNQRMRSVERFDLVNEIWNHVADMNVARSDASACVRKGLIYIAGGLNDQVIESSVEFYNELDDSWTFISSMVSPRTSFSLLLYQDKLLAIGGNNGHDRLASVEQYDFNTKIWSNHSSMRHRRSTFSAALLDDRRLIVVGGYNGQAPFKEVEGWDEQSGSWVSLQKIRFDRSGLKVVVVSDLPNITDYTYLGACGLSPAIEAASPTSGSTANDNSN